MIEHRLPVALATIKKRIPCWTGDDPSPKQVCVQREKLTIAARPDLIAKAQRAYRSKQAQRESNITAEQLRDTPGSPVRAHEIPCSCYERDLKDLYIDEARSTPGG
jgi:hypothetical protein